MEDKKIKVKLTDVVAISKDPLVDLATPTITKEDGNIVSTQTQAGGVVGAQTKKTEISAVELEENLKPENIVKDVSIFGVVGTQKTETAKLEKTITKNEHYNYKSPEDVVGYDEVDLVVDVKPTTTTLPTQYINENGDFTIEKPEDPYTRYNDINLYVDVQPNLQDKIVNVGSNGSETITADEEDPDGVKYDGLKSVKINVDVKPTLQEKTTFKNGIVKPDSGYDGLREVNVIVEPKLQSKRATVTDRFMPVEPIVPDEGFDGLSSVEINVDIPLKLQDKTVNITKNGQTTIRKQGLDYDGLGTVTVNVNVPSSEALINLVSNSASAAPTSFVYDGELKNEMCPLFYKNTYIQRIEVPNASIIPQNFAREATKLTYIDIGKSNTIGQYAFYNSFRISTVIGKPKTIESNAFYNIGNSATNMTIDLSEVETIGTNAFATASGYGSRLSGVIELPKLVSIGSSAFSYQRGITKIVLDKCADFAAQSFQYCTGLTTVDMLGYYANEIVKPSSITSFGDKSSFANCSVLSTIIIRSGFFLPMTATLSLPSNSPIYKKTGSIYVPDELVETYKAATNWSSYATMIKPLSTYVEA